MFCKKSVLKNFVSLIRKQPVLESLFIKVAGLKVCNFIKMRLQHKCFSVKYAKFLRTLIVKIICERLLLHFQSSPNRHLLLQSQQWKHQNNVNNLFKVNNKREQKDVKGVVLLSLLLTLSRFYTLFWFFMYNIYSLFILGYKHKI